ncbi:hypothetical protein LX32DRAFT_567856 [Colletotrichum zoysiae]|uniref:Fungal N-terminal domain-containing protein n=1 Tax=Colletotrichum zoysiae TaxID=1216348 RepID=A0AAD9HB76_9PEZI|nr:hypothetical protein LX32DRAFT_567856 [Colletotrichum zoysiae]
MAEPVGITGTAAGLVSLGLQLYGEISKYLNAVKGRQKDLDRARRHHQTLQMCMDAIAAATSSSRGNNAQTNAALNACVLSCESELSALKALVDRLQGPPSAAGGALSTKLREKGRQYAFPFHRESILELERMLESTNGVLQTALQTLGFDVASSIRSDLELVRITHEDTRANVSSIEQSVNDVFTAVSQIEQIVPSINAQVTASTSAMMVQQSQTWSRTTDISTRTEENTKSILQEVSLVRSQQNRIEEILTAMAQRPANLRDQDVEIARLVAKPADLKTMCDAILQPQAPTERFGTTSVSNMNDRLCPCVKRRSLQREEITWGPMFYTKLKRLTEHHLPGCPWQNLAPTECRLNRAFGFKLYEIGPLLKGAIRFTWSLSFGAGGLSINQTLNLGATVSGDRSPVFRISSLLFNCLLGDTLNTREKETFAEECFKGILRCYSGKLACPSDVNDDGATLPATLMHRANMLSSTGKSTRCIELMAKLALHFMKLNVPLVAAHDFTLWEIYNLLLRHNELGISDISRSIIQIWTCSTEFVPIREIGIPALSSPTEAVVAMQNSLYRADLVECGSLALSILRGDEMAVAQTLESYQYTFNEVNSLGQTPCHVAIAVGNLRILQLVLLYTDPDVLNTPDNRGYYPVDYALSTCVHQGCQESQDSSVCNGCKVLEMVLNSDCALYPYTLHHALCDQNLAKSTRKMFIGHLRLRRKAFEALALTILSNNEASNLGIHPSRVLDKNAVQLQRHLDDHCFLTPSHLRVYPKGQKRKSDFSVYTWIYEKDVAVFAWSQGFKDTIVQSYGANPSMRPWWYLTPKFPRFSKEIALYISWIIHHESDTSTTVWEHDFMEPLGKNLIDYERNAFTLPAILSKMAFSESVTDCCSCYCSPGGCTPVDVFLCQAINDILKHTYYIPSWRKKDTTIDPSQYSEIGWRIVYTIRRLIGRKRHRSERYAWLHKAILRQLTFAVLDLTHTCCIVKYRHALRRHRRRRGLDVEESQEIHEEEQEKLQLLEDLVAEFAQECGSNAKLLTYLQDGWTPRMQSVMLDLTSRRLSPAERQAAEAVGVVWGPEKAEDSTKSTDLRIPWRYGAMEYYMRNLRRYVPENDISLPPGLQL